MGGTILTIAVFLILSFVRETRWLYSVAIASSCLMISRAISWAVDGYTQAGFTTLIIELMAVIIFIIVATTFHHSSFIIHRFSNSSKHTEIN